MSNAMPSVWKKVGTTSKGKPVWKHRSGAARVVGNGPDSWFAEVRTPMGWVKVRAEPFESFVEAKDYAEAEA